MRDGLHRYGIVLLAGCLLVACSKTPDGVLTEKEMQAVHLDVQLAEALISVENKLFVDSLQRAELFQSVFRKHGITQAMYDSSLIWYGRNLDVYMDVYDWILKDLNERQNILGDVQTSVTPVSIQDSIDIWSRRSFLRLEPQGVFNGVTFDIKPEASFSSGSSFVLGMSVWGVDKVMTHYPEIHICADLGDTIVIANDQITADGYHETLLKTVATKRVWRVYGYIFMNNTSSYYHRIYLDDISLVKYNYGREILERKAVTVPRSTGVE